MNKLNRAIDRFCILHPNFGIPNLMLYIVIANIAIGFLTILSQNSTLMSLLAFSPSAVMRGQVWRIVTFVFIPESTRPFSLLISCYFYYWIGSTLERQWGTSKFTVYYISGVALTVIGITVASLISGYSLIVYSAEYVNFAMFLAFASLFPDAQVLLLFFIPIRIKWVAYFDLAYFTFIIFYNLTAGAWYYALPPIIALLNYIICFYPQIKTLFSEKAYQAKQATHFHNTVRTQQRVEETQHEEQGFHRRCCVCGRTDASNPELEFRYCSKCAGYHCFCSDHLFSHIHFTDEQP